MTTLFETVIMGFGIATLSLLFLTAMTIISLKFLDVIEYVIENWSDRPELEIRWALWRNHAWGGIDKPILDSAEQVAEWEGVEEELEPTFRYYRNQIE
jgi:hypothetical protein